MSFGSHLFLETLTHALAPVLSPASSLSCAPGIADPGLSITHLKRLGGPSLYPGPSLALTSDSTFCFPCLDLHSYSGQHQQLSGSLPEGHDAQTYGDKSTSSNLIHYRIVHGSRASTTCGLPSIARFGSPCGRLQVLSLHHPLLLLVT